MPPCKIYILKNAHVGRNIISPKKLQDFPCSLYLLAAAVVYLLNFSKNLTCKYNRWINILASTTFAVYLIHNNPIISDWLWNTVVCADKYLESSFFLLHMLGVTTLIFGVCAILELIRLRIAKYYNNIMLR